MGILHTKLSRSKKMKLMKTLILLEACRHHEVEHLVYASSSSVYGSNKKGAL